MQKWGEEKLKRDQEMRWDEMKGLLLIRRFRATLLRGKNQYYIRVQPYRLVRLMNGLA